MKHGFKQLVEFLFLFLRCITFRVKFESLIFYWGHVFTFAQLLKTGLFVDPHHDADTPSGLEVNSTLYYVLSSFPTPASSSSSQTQKQEMEKLLHIPDHCFGGPPTM